MRAVTCQKQGGRGSWGGQRSRNSSQNRLTHRNPWRWLVDHGIAGCETRRLCNELSFDLPQQKCSRSGEEKSGLNYKNRVMAPPSIPDLSQLETQNTLKWGQQGPLEEGPWYTTENLYCSSFSPSSPKESVGSHLGNCALGRRE